jgi:GT2 family glycosyltransferase
MPHPTAISFVVPAYNVAPYIEECLGSIVAASQPGDQIIVVNDGSTDRTNEICRQWAQSHPELITLIEQQNQGLSAARNAALTQATCPYVLFMDSDDVVYTAPLTQLRPILAQHAPDVTVLDFFWWIPERQDERNRSPQCSHRTHALSSNRNDFEHS